MALINRYQQKTFVQKLKLLPNLDLQVRYDNMHFIVAIDYCFEITLIHHVDKNLCEKLFSFHLEMIHFFGICASNEELQLYRCNNSNWQYKERHLYEINGCAFEPKNNENFHWYQPRLQCFLLLCLGCRIIVVPKSYQWTNSHRFI